MAMDLFQLMGGIRIEADNLSSRSDILQGSGLPGGDAGFQDAAGIGSLYMRTDAETNNLQLYYKWSTINNSAADWKAVTDKAYVDALINGISWREPIAAISTTTYATLAAALTALNATGTIDGYTVQTGDRIVFSNITAGGENVQIVSGSFPTFTLTSDPTNTLSDGDAVLVQKGATLAETSWVYDGTSTWVQFGGNASAELGFLRSYVGKTGPGAELPTYSSTDVVDQSDNLEVAIGRLDNVMGNGVITNQGANWALTDDLTWDGATSAGNTGTLEITDALNELNTAIGDRTFTNSGVNITNGDTNAVSIDNLNEAIIPLQQNSLEIAGSEAATVTTTMDTLPLAVATEAKWLVQVRETGTPANRRSVEVHAMNNGSTLVDHTEYAVLRLGGVIAGLNINVAISGTDMVLTVYSTNGVDYVVKRIAYSAF